MILRTYPISLFHNKQDVLFKYFFDHIDNLDNVPKEYFNLFNMHNSYKRELIDLYGGMNKVMPVELLNSLAEDRIFAENDQINKTIRRSIFFTTGGYYSILGSILTHNAYDQFKTLFDVCFGDLAERDDNVKYLEMLLKYHNLPEEIRNEIISYEGVKLSCLNLIKETANVKNFYKPRKLKRVF